jgi:hypothetical protein
MAYRWHPRNAEVDPESPRAWGTCDRCGFVYNLNKLQWQYSYQGAFVPVNTRFLVCERCLDPLNEQDQGYILPPDPEPIYNARPEPYTLDEASWLATQDGEPLITQDGEYLTPQVPGPDSTASAADQAAVNLTTEDGLEIVTEAGDGNPLDLEPNP